MKAYNIKMDHSFFDDTQSKGGEYSFLENYKKGIRRDLSDLINHEGDIKAADIEQNWFPKTPIDVFISHSHKDKELAIKFAKWLHDSFKLESFVDSFIWGHSTELKKQIDDKYSVKKNKDNIGSKVYDYDKSRNSTTHVNMILSGALLKMIANSKAVFFINTPNSINTPEKSVSGETYSPWIYIELLFTHYMAESRLKVIKERIFVGDSEPELKISFDINKEHLIDLDNLILRKWKAKFSVKSNKDSLEMLDELIID